MGAGFRVGVDPLHHCLEHNQLRANTERGATQELLQFFHWQILEFSICCHLLEVPQDKVISHLQELPHPIGLSERCHLQAGSVVHFPSQEVETQRKGGLELEL